MGSSRLRRHAETHSIVLKCQKQHEVHHDSEPAVF